MRFLKAMDEFREQRERAFNALRSQWEEDLVDEPTSLYDDEELYASTEPYNTEAVTGEVVRTEKLDKPSSTALYEIFDQLDASDFYADDSPKTSVVNDKLEDQGYRRLDKETIERSAQQWLRAREGRATKVVTKKRATKKRATKKRARKTAKKATKTSTTEGA